MVNGARRDQYPRTEMISVRSALPMVNDARQQEVVDLPNLEIYMVCKTPRHSDKMKLSPNPSYMIRELRDFYQRLLNLPPSTDDDALTLYVNSTSCVTSNALRAVKSFLISSGTIDWSKLSSNGKDNMTTFYSANELQGMVTKSGLQDAMANLCSVVLSFQANIQAAGSPPQAGWDNSSFCHKSELSPVSIVYGGLVVLCFVCSLLSAVRAVVGCCRQPAVGESPYEKILTVNNSK